MLPTPSATNGRRGSTGLTRWRRCGTTVGRAGGPIPSRTMLSNLKSETLARGAPLLSEDRVDRLAVPLALAPRVLDQVRLPAHAESLKHAHRRRVARLDAAVDAVQAVRGERELDDRLGRLGRVAVTL